MKARKTIYHNSSRSVSVKSDSAAAKKRNKRLLEMKLRELEKVQMEMKTRLEKETQEHTLREQRLTALAPLFKRISKRMINEKKKVRDLEEWLRYTTMVREPAINQPTSTRNYFYVWQKTTRHSTLEEVYSDLKRHLELFELVSKFLEEPITLNRNKIKALRELLSEWKTEYLKQLDYGCFLKIKHLNSCFTNKDYLTKEFFSESEFVKLAMWASVEKPVRKNFWRPPPKIEFFGSKLIVTLPEPYNLKPIVLRVMHTEFDFLSDSSKSMNQPDFSKPTNLLFEVKNLVAQKEKIIAELEERKKDEAEGLLGSVSNKSLIMSSESNCPSFEDILDRRHAGHDQSPLVGSKESLISKSVAHMHRKTSIHSMYNQRLRADISLGSVADGSRRGFNIDTSPKLRHKYDSFMSQQTTNTATFATQSNVFSSGSMKYSTHQSSLPFPKLRGSSKLSMLDYEQEDYFSKNKKIDLNTLDDNNLSDIRKELAEHGDSIFAFFDFLFAYADKGDDETGIKTLRELFLLFKLKRKPKLSLDEKLASENDVSQLFSKALQENYQELVKPLIIDLEANEINLRKYNILGGIHFIDLIVAPSDLWWMQNGDCIKYQYGPDEILKEKFIVEYEEPPILIEKYHPHIYGNVGELSLIPFKDPQLRQLICISIELEKGYFWFGTPIPVLWDEQKKVWSTDYIHDVSYENKTRTISFKLGKVGPIGMAVLRYHELPYKNWKMKPSEAGDEVILTLEGQSTLMEFTISSMNVSLTKLIGGFYSKLDDIVGKQFRVSDLVFELRKIGLNVFPDDDTFLYIDGCSCKPLALEDHTYISMALFAKTLKYTASSWNFALGWENLLFQCCLANPSDEIYTTIKVNNFKTEVSFLKDKDESYSDLTNRDLGFFPDVYYIFHKLYGQHAKFSSADIPLITNVYNMLSKTKILTFSGNKEKMM